MTKAPTWFNVIAAIGLFWNVLGAVMVVMNFMITPEAIAALPAAQQQMYTDTPMWSSYGSLVAVFAGVIGCVGLLLKKAWASILFMLSIVGLVLQNIGIFVIVDAVSVMGESVLMMQGMVALIAFGLLFLARVANKREWIEVSI
jgi:hypothetical protein